MKGMTRWGSLGVLVASVGAAAEPQGADRLLVGFSQCNNAEPWRESMNRAARTEAAKHPQLELVFADARQDNARQVADVEGFLRQRVDLLIISPNEAKPLTRVVKQVFDAGIPVIVLDRKVEGDAYTCFIGADNRLIGREAGSFIAKLLNGRGRIVEIKGLPGSTPAIDRSRGFREALASFPDIEIIHDPVADWLREKGKTQMEIALRAHEQIDLVYAHNDPMAIGAYLAARQVGREKNIRFIGIDALPGPEGGAQAVLDGKLEATFHYPNCGKEAVETALRILKGEPAPKTLTMPAATVTRENAARFAAVSVPPKEGR